MTKVCIFCRTNAVDDHAKSVERGITGGICRSCEQKFQTSSSTSVLRSLAETIDAPVLVMQAEPRQVYTANRKALELFNKELHQIEKHRGGQVFDCVHAFTAAGCGKDEHCRPCKLKSAIVATLSTGHPYQGVSALLDIRKSTGTSTYTVQVSTEKIGDMALIRIDQYNDNTP
jgi:hypothetical protein